MAHLSDDALFHGSLPAQWQPLLELLRDLDALTSEATSLDSRRPRAAALRAKMLAHAAHLEEDLPSNLRETHADYRRWFTEAVLLWPWFAEAGGKVLLDTLGGTSLANFPVDFIASENDREELRQALGRVFGWTPQDLLRMEATIVHLTDNLRVKRAISGQICRRLRPSEGGDVASRAVELMRQVYGPLPWRPGDVDVVVTTANLFLCIPYEGTRLALDDYPHRPADEREPIARFLERVRAEQQSLKSVRFPSFGLFDPEAVDPAFRAGLAHGVRQQPGLAGASDRVVADTFATMVTVLPTYDVDKYLVHDVWGHGWQETLCEFEWTFRDLAAIGEPLTVPSEARSSLAALRSAVEPDLRRRIMVGLNLVVSESLADLVEHKPCRAGAPLPSSSLLPLCPLRLDLSLLDGQRMVRAWRRAYLGAKAGTGALIEDRFGPDVWLGLGLGLAFEDSLEVVPLADGTVRATVLQRIMLGMVAFDAAVDRFLARADAHRRVVTAKGQDAQKTAQRWRCPVACIDLLVLLLGWFYEQERRLHVWHLDELLNKELWGTLQRLEQALGSRG